MINKIELTLAIICIFLATAVSWEVSKWKNQREALQNKVECSEKTNKDLSQQNQTQIQNVKKIIASKQIAEINHNLDRDQLIERL